MKECDILVQLDDAVYARLKKDADDNRQLVKLMGSIVLIATLTIIFFTWGRRVLDLDIQRRQAELDRQIALEQAENEVRVREIEMDGFTFDEYITWLNAREKD